MKSKITILRQYVPEGVLPNLTEQCIADGMDTYAKQQAEALINEFENEWNGYESLPADYVINLIKKQFNIV